MLKKTEILVSSCLKCPFLIVNDGFASHSYICSKLELQSSESFGHNEDDVQVELDFWFEKKCDLDNAY
jgi:hypothetical protein